MKLWPDRNQQRFAAERILRRAFRVAPAMVGICVTTGAFADSPSRARPRRAPAVENAAELTLDGNHDFLDDTSLRGSVPGGAAQTMGRQTTGNQATANQATAIQTSGNQAGGTLNGVTQGAITKPVAKFLPTGGAELYANRAEESFEQARLLYFKGAFASAEESAWKTLAAAANEISRRLPAHPYGDPVEALSLARTAMTEARDFAGRFDERDSAAIRRMVRSHRTKSLKDQSLVRLSMTDASDVYLDDAREQLAILSTQSVIAARAMDLLAAIALSRDEASTLPSATAICLRRAALQGQPGNASLARRLAEHLDDVGLTSEAQHVFAHAAQVPPSDGRQNALPMKIETVSPHVFATMARPAQPSVAQGDVQRASSSSSINAQVVSHRVDQKGILSPSNAPAFHPARQNPQAVDTTPVTVQEGFWSRITPSFFRGGNR